MMKARRKRLHFAGVFLSASLALTLFASCPGEVREGNVPQGEPPDEGLVSESVTDTGATIRRGSNLVPPELPDDLALHPDSRLVKTVVERNGSLWLVAEVPSDAKAVIDYYKESFLSKKWQVWQSGHEYKGTLYYYFRKENRRLQLMAKNKGEGKSTVSLIYMVTDFP